MPSMIPRGVGFTHIQVYTNSIGTVELDVTSFHVGPLLHDWEQFTLVSVIKKCLFRALPGNDFAVLKRERVVTNHGVYPIDHEVFDELLGFTVPHLVPDELRFLVDNLRWTLATASENAAAMATFLNPCEFGAWFTALVPTVTQVLCDGILIVGLPKDLGIVIPLRTTVKESSNETPLQKATKKRPRNVRKKRSIKKFLIRVWDSSQILVRLFSMIGRNINP